MEVCRPVTGTGCLWKRQGHDTVLLPGKAPVETRWGERHQAAACPGPAASQGRHQMVFPKGLLTAAATGGPGDCRKSMREACPVSGSRLTPFCSPTQAKESSRNRMQEKCFALVQIFTSSVAWRLVLTCKAGRKLCSGGGGVCGEEGSQLSTR